MLSFKLNGDILEVVQTLNSWARTDREFWYYNIKSWMKSITGQENSEIVQVMDAPQIEWVKKYYLPKVLDIPDQPDTIAQLNRNEKENG